MNWLKSLTDQVWMYICFILCTLLVSLSVSAWITSGRLDQAHKDLGVADTQLRITNEALGNSEQLRDRERHQCAQDFAGEVERNKIDLANAVNSATARASLTKNCAFDKGPKAVDRSLRDILGERK